MFKIYFTTVIMLFIASRSNGQSIKDSVFYDVVRITDSNTVKAGESYLIDIPLDPSKKIVAFYNESRVPNELIIRSGRFYPELKEFYLISPDWNYYSSTPHVTVAGTDMICAEPVASTIIYKVTRADQDVKVDSLQRIGSKQPQVNFEENNSIPDSALVSYFSEEFGSVCCPRDPKWDLEPTPKEFIDYYQKQYNTKIENTYKRIAGKEGEHILYYTLADLSNGDRLKFILLRSYFLIPDHHLIDFLPGREILTPTLVIKKGLKLALNE